MMNDGRNNTEYQCVTLPSTLSNPTESDILEEGGQTILYVVGEYQYNYYYYYVRLHVAQVNCNQVQSFQINNLAR